MRVPGIDTTRTSRLVACHGMIQLRDQPLLRRAFDRGRQRLSSTTGRDSSFVRELGPAPLERDGQSVSKLLYERLDAEDVAEVERRLAEAPELRASPLDPTDMTARRWQVLSYGMWLGVGSVADKTGLLPLQPPDDVHAMARGPLAAAGGLYEADLIVNALSSAGIGMDAVQSGLDFGCSSGRVVRVLAAAYPAVRWMGCDPNERAVAWARDSLAGIQFFINPQQPPLSVECGSIDLVYAISIWSHFAPELGLRWFDEMHRLLRSGGHLVCTTHGVTSISFYATHGMRSAEQSDQISSALYRQGWWYAAEFGFQGDAGVVNPAWGTAFLSPEWMLTKLCPQWRVLEFAPGRNQSNQDVYVLQRV